MKTGLIGTGYWGKIIEPKLKNLTDLRFVANSKNNLDEILSTTDAEYIFVCTPTRTHFDIVKKCLVYNKNVFCEKPFTGNYEDALRLFIIADHKDLNIFVDNIFLHRKEFLNYKKDNFNYKHYKFEWLKISSLNDTIINSLLYHDIYILIQLTGLTEWKIIYKSINDETLILVIKAGTHTVDFFYDRNCNCNKKTIKINNDLIDFSNPLNDPLNEIINLISNRSFDKSYYSYNRKITFDTLKLLNKIKLH
jgi:hypothetical protein